MHLLACDVDDASDDPDGTQALTMHSQRRYDMPSTPLVLTRYHCDSAECLNATFFRETDLHPQPYKHTIESLVAVLSIKNRCYGRQLDLIYSTIRGVGMSIPPGAAKSAAELEAIEVMAMYDGLKFETKTVSVPNCPQLSPELTMLLYPSKMVIRKDMAAAVAELLTRRGVYEHLHWKWEGPVNDSGHRLYEGFYTGNVWKEVQDKLGASRDLAGLLIFSDSTQILNFGSRSLHPIYLAPAGLHFDHMGLNCISLIGFVPSLPSHAKDIISDSSRQQLAAWTRLMLASVYADIIEDIHRHTTTGIAIHLRDYNIHTVHPFVLTAISDHVEGNNIAMLEMLKCRYCVTDKEDYATTDNVGTPRDTRHSNEMFANLNPLSTAALLPFDIYGTAHCIFHDVDEGLSKWILHNILVPLFKHPQDQRHLAIELSALTHVTGLQRWHTITEDSTKYLNARKMRQLIVQIVVVLAAWTFRDQVRDSVFLSVLALCNWYRAARSRVISEPDVAQLNELAVSLRKALRDAATDYDSKAIKHHVILHYPDLIRKFGAMLHQSCEMWDSAHKFMIKAHLSSHGRTNFQKTVEQRVRRVYGSIFLNEWLSCVILFVCSSIGDPSSICTSSTAFQQSKETNISATTCCCTATKVCECSMEYQKTSSSAMGLH